jgi:FAD:protein FMN transferase
MTVSTSSERALMTSAIRAVRRFAVSYVAGSVLIATALLAASCSPNEARREIVLRGHTMGTDWLIRCVVPVSFRNDVVVGNRVETRLSRVNSLISGYADDSEILRFNRSRSTDWFTVAPETASVVAQAQKVSEASNGALDITIAPALRMWGFGPGAQYNGIVDGSELQEIRNRVGYRRVEVRTDPPALRKEIPDVEVDLSAVGEGFGVDEVSRELEACGCSGHLVEIGGDLLVRGRKADGSIWQIGIEKPDLAERTATRTLHVTDMAVATSGVYRNFRQNGKSRRPHILDGRTLKPVEHELLSVTVMADSCLEADARATALLVLGPDEGYRIARENKIAALLVYGKDRLRWLETPAWRSLRAAGGRR